ncbi:MAG: phosphoribosylglycinamide formyltransferase [Anaerolineales bacterium]|nr:phosphoribosylglycinamide formyltransferase [Anaerolineales bacterium]
MDRESLPQLYRFVVLVSGYGSNLQAMLNACDSGELPGEVVAVIADRPSAYGLERAFKARIPAVYKPKRAMQTRREYDAELAELVKVFRPDWVVLTDWTRLLTMEFLSHFPNRVINLHPALPGTFPGMHAIRRAYEAFLRGQIDQTGVMVHLVVDEGVVNGPVLLQETVPIHPNDSLYMLENRVQAVEQRLLITALKDLCLNGLAGVAV